MTTFNEIAGKSAQEIQKMLKAVENEVLATALKGADKTVLDAILKSMSARAGEMLTEDLNYMPQPSEEKTKFARDTVIKLFG